LAITQDSERSTDLAFSPPFFATESTYLASPVSPIQSITKIDQASRRVVVNRGTALAVVLSTTLASAELLRVGPGEAVPVVRGGGGCRRLCRQSHAAPRGRAGLADARVLEE